MFILIHCELYLVSYRTQFFLKHPSSLWSLKLSCTILTMGLMVPVSFSMFPQVGRVRAPIRA